MFWWLAGWLAGWLAVELCWQVHGMRPLVVWFERLHCVAWLVLMLCQRSWLDYCLYRSVASTATCAVCACRAAAGGE